MNLRNPLVAGTIAGIVMGIGLFLTGAVAAFLVYGPQMAPEGKFQPDQMNPWYFIWTKLLIGWFFGILFTLPYARLRDAFHLQGLFGALIYAFALWLIVSLWGISHPLVYETIATKNQLFWHIYSLGGFLAYGITLGLLFRSENQQNKTTTQA